MWARFNLAVAPRAYKITGTAQLDHGLEMLDRAAEFAGHHGELAGKLEPLSTIAGGQYIVLRGSHCLERGVRLYQVAVFKQCAGSQQ